MGMFSVGLEHSCLVVVVDAVVDGDVVSVVVVNDVFLLDTVPVVEVVPGFGLLSVLSTTMSTRTFTGKGVDGSIYIDYLLNTLLFLFASILHKALDAVPDIFLHLCFQRVRMHILLLPVFCRPWVPLCPSVDLLKVLRVFDLLDPLGISLEFLVPD